MILEMKKILYIITKSNWGGAQRYVYDIATKVPKDEYDVIVAAGGNGPLIERLNGSNIKTVVLPSLGRDISPLKDLSSFFDILKLIKKERPDIVHLNSSKIGGMGAVASRLAFFPNFKRIPKIIFTAHGFAFNEDRTFLAKIIIGFTYWVSMNLCHKIITVSDTMAKTVHLWPGIPKKTVVIKNSIAPSVIYAQKGAAHELGEMNPKIKAILKADPSMNKTLWIGTVAELHPIKGYEYAIKAIALLVEKMKNSTNGKSRIIYTIMGEGADRQRLEALIKHLGLEENIILMGHVKNASEYIKAFDIFLFPSLSEGLCYALIEAGLASLPCIASSVGGIPEIIDDMKTGILIQPRNEKDIAHAIEFYSTHKDIAKEYGKALHTSVTKRFNFEEMVKNTIASYK